MAHIPQVRIPATYLRGGTSKGVFPSDLPERCQVPGPGCLPAGHRQLLTPRRPHGRQWGRHLHLQVRHPPKPATLITMWITSTARVANDKAFVDWSGNCGNLHGAGARHPRRPGRTRPHPDSAPARCASGRLISVNHRPGAGDENGQVQETGDRADGHLPPPRPVLSFFALRTRVRRAAPSSHRQSGGRLEVLRLL